jgi:hypothetical protein
VSAAECGVLLPGLIPTPPATPTEADDGYNSASKIVSLKLSLQHRRRRLQGRRGAVWPGAGIRLCGHRALLVSHWSVNCKATVKLITDAICSMSAEGSIGPR